MISAAKDGTGKSSAAPDIAGKNLADSIAQILSSAPAQRHCFSLNDAAAANTTAV
jgi:isocitrate/isopropylmalate dehydrogenase